MTRPRTSRVDDAQIVALRLSGLTQQGIAERLGVSTEAVKRHLRKPDVEQAITDARTQVLTETADALTAMAKASVVRLGRVMRDGSDANAVAAARVLLTCALVWHDRVDLDARLTALEEVQAATPGAAVLPWRP